MALGNIGYWAYQIQDITEDGVVQALADSHYDMLVLEPTRTDWSSDDKLFDTKAMVTQLKASLASDGIHNKLVLAYLDIGEAEDWRWYWTWSMSWNCNPPLPPGWPDYIIACDPDGWTGNYPVAYWDADWKDVIIYGNNQSSSPWGDYNSVIDEVIKDGFDGIYLDWVEAYEDDDVIAAAQAAGKDPDTEMIAFIQEMKAYGTARDPDFLIVQQNAASLIDGNPGLTSVIDAIAQEAIWYDGDATDNWYDGNGYDWENETSLTNEYNGYLAQYLSAGLPVFDCEYALDDAKPVYASSAAAGYIPYVTRRSLGWLTTTPPPGYLSSLCAATPEAGCRQAASGKARLQIKDVAGGDRDQIKWKWTGAATVNFGDFDDPEGGSVDYRLCVYDSSGGQQPLVESAVLTGSACGTRSCWRETGGTGYKFKDRTATPDGITQMKLKEGTAGRARVQAKAKGVSLDTPSPPLTLPVTVQLLIDDGATSDCWQATYSDFQRNEAGIFKARGQ